MKDFITKLAQSLFWGMLLVFIVAACSSATKSELQFDYELRQEKLQHQLQEPLFVEVEGNHVNFSIVFQGGGSENESAKFEMYDNILRIDLINRDSISQKILVLYYFYGSIDNIDPGSYNLYIEDSTGRPVGEASFEVP